MSFLRTVAAEYAIAYRDCYRWLYRWCPPWRWLLSAVAWSGSPAWRDLKDLHTAAGAR